MDIPPRDIRWTPARTAWAVAMALLLAISLIFTFYGTPNRLAQRFPSTPAIGTLDGTDYMDTATYPTSMGEKALTINLKYDHEAIQWMNANIHGVKVVAEGAFEMIAAGAMDNVRAIVALHVDPDNSSGRLAYRHGLPSRS